MSVARGNATDFSCVTTKNITMKGANFLEKLLDNQPVEWKKLGEVCGLITDFTAAGSFASNAKNVKYLNNPDYALLVRTTDLKQKFQNEDRFIYVDEKAYEYLWRVKLDAESIIMPNVGNCGEIYFVTPEQLPHSRCVLGPNALLIRSEIANQKFLYYLFHSVDFQVRLSKITSSTGQTKFNKTNLKQFPIPIPPLSVQSRIVEILDKFTSLEAELEAELELRKKQYSYYREQLLNFSYTPPSEFNVVYKKLGEVAQYSKGRIDASTLSAKNYVGVDNLLQDCQGKKLSEHVPTEGRCTSYSPKDILIGNIRPYLKKIWFADNAGGTNGDVLVIQTTDECVLPEYLYQVLSDDAFFTYDMQHAKGAKMPRGNKDKILDYKIPLPPLSEQERIVEILDKFDTLTNSISEGLPLEIQLRRQQYEYYREQLLDFRR